MQSLFSTANPSLYEEFSMYGMFFKQQLANNAACTEKWFTEWYQHRQQLTLKSKKVTHVMAWKAVDDDIGGNFFLECGRLKRAKVQLHL